MRRRLAAVPLCVLAGLVLIGCGNHRVKAPDLGMPQPPKAFRSYSYASAQLRFSAPRNWSQRAEKAPMVAVVSSGRATVAIWRYPRSEPLPTTQAGLKDARAALTDAATARDRRLTILSSRVLANNGVPGTELLVDETIDGQARRVRSTHLFAGAAEYVIDASAPPDVFMRVDSTVFAPIVASVAPGPNRSGTK